MFKHLQLKTLLLLACMVMGAGSAWADTSTLTFTKACGGSGTADDGATWTVTSDASESTYDSTKGIHYGTGSAAVSYLQLSTSSITGTITKIEVNASGASGTSAKLNVTVDGSAFGSQQSLTTTATTYTLSGSASGDIVVKLTQSSAKKALYVKSIVVTYTSGGGSTVYSPAITPAGGTYNNAPTITINSATEDASIYYTIDGTNPDDTKTLYAVPFTLNESCIVKAIAMKEGLTTSSISSASYTLKVADPTFSVAGGTIIAAQDVAITTETEGATIYYTTDGTAPTTSSEVYTAPIHVDANTTIKALATKTGFNDSSVATATYTFFAMAAKNINSGYFEKVTDAATLEDGDAILILHEQENAMAMSTTQNGNNRGQEKVTLTSGTTYAPSTSVQKLVLKKVTESEKDYFYFYAGTGFLYAASSSSNYLRTEGTPDDNAKATISISGGDATIKFQGTNTRNKLYYNSSSSIFSCYSNAQQTVQIYKEVEKTQTASVTSAGYATLCSAYALDFSGFDGLAYTASVSGDVVTFDKVTGTVPANTGLLLKGEGNYDIPVVASSTTDVSGNALVGSVAGGVIGKTTDGKTNYVLKQVDDVVGFYQVNNDSYKVRAGSAYLAVDLGGSAKPFIGLGDETSVNEELRIQHSEFAPVYNLAGQRVDAGFHGIVIQNGKKVIR